MTKKATTHGGARPGAGRPKNPNAKVTISSKIAPDLAELIDVWRRELAERTGEKLLSRSAYVEYHLRHTKPPLE